MKYAVIEAFSARPGSGNPAAVCFTERPLPAPLMQRAAAELALPETAFLTPWPDGFGLRWFTPAAEIDLCGHATMAAGYFVMNLLCPALTEVRFRTPAGILPARKKDGLYEIELPARAPRRIAFPEEARRALGLPPAEAWSSRDLIFVLSDEGAVRGYVPDYGAMSVLTRQWLGVVITAKGKETDFVSRFFARSWPTKTPSPVPLTRLSSRCGAKGSAKRNSPPPSSRPAAAVFSVKRAPPSASRGRPALSRKAGSLSDRAERAQKNSLLT